MLYLEPLQLTVTEAALGLQVTRKTLSAFLNMRSGVSPEMALKLSKAFRTTPEHWLNLQQAYNLWRAKQEQTQLMYALSSKRMLRTWCIEEAKFRGL